MTRRIVRWVAAAAALLFAVAPLSDRGVRPAVSVTPGPQPCFPRSSQMPSTLYVADVGRLSSDEQLMYAALQGIVNRSGPQIYLEGEGSDTTSGLWLAKGAVPLPTETVAPAELLTRFASYVKGLVVWDPSLAVDTENVATTIAGTDGLLPVSPTLAAQLLAPPYNLAIRVDLRNEHFTGRDQAYAWAMTHFGFPDSRVLAWIGGTGNGLRDLIVACRGFAFQADPELDVALVEQILRGYPPLTPVFGYPCLDDEILSATEHTDGTGIPVCEPAGVSEISESGKYLIPADLSTNLTVHAAFPPSVRAPPWDDRPQAPDPTKTYVTFVISDGDNVGYNEQYMLDHQWSDPGHGHIPMGVSISPWLDVYAPNLYAYYVDTTTPEDVLLAGPSGGGYAYPGEEADLSGYLGQTQALMDQAGLSTPWILDNGYASSPSPPVIDDYVRTLHPPGIFTDYFGWTIPNPPAVSFDQGVPVAHAVWGSCVADTVGRIRLTAATAPTRPNFVFVALNTWQMSFSSAMTVMSELGPNYVVVRPDQFFELIRGAGQVVPTVAPPSTSPSPPATNYCVP
ncbi:MAG TPA: hypothetical protein DCQ30_02570 [Acidimicrobiaceae bacterium]|nr:hypothetical protein [Acidimicrobiaceae bacterium]